MFVHTNSTIIPSPAKTPIPVGHIKLRFLCAFRAFFLISRNASNSSSSAYSETPNNNHINHKLAKSQQHDVCPLFFGTLPGCLHLLTRVNLADLPSPHPWPGEPTQSLDGDQMQFIQFIREVHQR